MKRLIKKSELMDTYHGTSSDKLDSILSSGLKITVGGSGDGAYVSKDFNEARKYAIKRAGDRKIAAAQHGIEKYKDVYPVVLTISIDSNELKPGYDQAMFAEQGISPDKITNKQDLSNDPIWQSLLAYLNSDDKSSEEAIQHYREYYNEVGSIV